MNVKRNSFLLFFCCISLMMNAQLLKEETDTVASLFMEALDMQQYEKAATIGLALIDQRKDELWEKDYSPLIYSYTAYALSALGRYTIVPQIVRMGKPFVNKFLSKSDTEYYYLPITEIMVNLLMVKPEIADSVYSQLYIDAFESEDRPASLRSILPSLREKIDSCYISKNEFERDSIAKSLYNLTGKIMLANARSEDGADLWRWYFDEMRYVLTSYYYDMNSAKDEDVWSHLLATMKVNFYICCDQLIHREDVAYNNALLEKNFLDLHSFRLNKKVVTWKDVQLMLDENEAAIEIRTMPEEVLILKADYNHPLSVRIDSLLFNKLTVYKGVDAFEISEMYQKEGPLAQLWNMIEPYIEDVSTIYFSPSNIFACFNYGAIPIGNGEIVASKYDFHNIVSTADIIYSKSINSNPSYHSATIIGAVDYNTPIDEMKEKTLKQGHVSYDCNNNVDKLTFALFQNGKHKNLAFSGQEVKAVDSLLTANGIASILLTGSDANEEAVKHLSYCNADILHISTHGFDLSPKYRLNTRDTTIMTSISKRTTILDRSGLLLSGANHAWNGEEVQGIDDGILTSREIEMIKLNNTKLAILSACKTGLGDDTNLTGLVYGPQYALKTAGVEQVMLSLWDVDDEATSILMKHFYGSLIKGAQPRIALREAQKQLINDGFTDPFYWAAFVVLE